MEPVPKIPVVFGQFQIAVDPDVRGLLFGNLPQRAFRSLRDRRF